MGCFSWTCPCCGHSIRASHATNAESAWLADAVLVEDGSVIRGEYDGYGRLQTRSGREVELGDGPSPTLVHQACYDLMKPQNPVYGPSRHARDQGHFVGDYDPKKPRSIDDIQALAKTAKDKIDREREEFRIYRETRRAELVTKGESIPEWL